MTENEKEILTQVLSMIITQTKDIEYLKKDYERILNATEKQNKELSDIKEILKNNINGGDNAKITTMEGETQNNGVDVMGFLAKGFNNITEKNPELAVKLIDKFTDKFGDSINKILNLVG